MVPEDVPFDDALFCFAQDSDQGALLKSPSRDWRLHIELAIHQSLANVQRVMALVVTGAECSLAYGKPEQFPGPSAYVDGYGSQIMQIQTVKI